MASRTIQARPSAINAVDMPTQLGNGTPASLNNQRNTTSQRSTNPIRIRGGRSNHFITGRIYNQAAMTSTRQLFQIFHVDAFTDKPFAGNPAAVCLLTEDRSAQWMQSVAAEMNLSETAFVRELEEGYELRWFTPTVEVD